MLGPPETQNPPDAPTSEGSKSQSGEDRLGNKNTPNRRSVDDYARERFRLDTSIKRILRADAAKVAPGKFPANVHRTVACTWARIGDVSLVRPMQAESYHYKGLATCGSVHTCPICASKIQERRRQEVAAAILYCYAINRAPVMVSYTFPHRVDQRLSLLLRLQQEAIKLLRGSRGYMALMLKAGSAGRIRTLEVTHGANGWHPHTHELLFLAPDVPAACIREELADLWLSACTKVGLFKPDRDKAEDFLRHAVDARDGDEGIASYMAKMDDQSKWGLSHELTKSSSKQGRRSGAHPFKLADTKATEYLFVEYVYAMKGQRQLVWSRGLKSAVGIQDKTDEEVASEETAKAQDRIDIPALAWKYVLGNDARFELTQAAKHGSGKAVRDLLTLLGWREE